MKIKCPACDDKHDIPNYDPGEVHEYECPSTFQMVTVTYPHPIIETRDGYRTQYVDCPYCNEETGIEIKVYFTTRGNTIYEPIRCPECTRNIKILQEIGLNRLVGVKKE